MLIIIFLHDQLTSFMFHHGTLSTSVQYSSFHRLKIPHFSGAVVSLLLLSDDASEGRFHVLRAFVAVLPFGVPSSCSCLLGC